MLEKRYIILSVFSSELTGITLVFMILFNSLTFVEFSFFCISIDGYDV